MPEQKNIESKELLNEGGMFSAIPARYVVATMCFLGLAVEFLIKVSLSVAIVAMVKVENNSTESQGFSELLNVAVRSEESDTCPGSEMVSESESENGEFEWDEELQGYILSSYYYGYMATHLLGGRLSEIFGTKLVFGSGVFIAGLITALSPLATRLDSSGLITARVLVGLSGGVVVPSMHNLLSKWFVPQEMLFLGAFMMAGNPAGAMLSMATSGVLAEAGGWTMVFYVFGGVAMFFVVPWAFLIYDTPSKHPRISTSEKEYILDGTGQNKERNNKVSHPVPWLAIFTSRPMYVHIIMGIGAGWVNYTIMTELPSYLSNVLHFDVQASGTISALPYVFLVITSLISGYVSQKLTQSGRLSKINVYRIFNALSGYGAALCLLLVTFVGCDDTANVVLMVTTQALSGGYQGGSLFNHLDLGSHFSGTLAGISFTMISTMGVLAPTFVGLIISDQQSISSWKTVFYVGAAISAVCTTIYMLFGSADEQPWNKLPEQSSQSHEEEGKV